MRRTSREARGTGALSWCIDITVWRRLGPRKAGALLRAITRAGGYVESRKQVWHNLGVMGSQVFRNAAPYLRIRVASKGEWSATPGPGAAPSACARTA